MPSTQTFKGNFIVKIVQRFFSKLTQNPEFYNIKYYQKHRNRFKNSHPIF